MLKKLFGSVFSDTPAAPTYKVPEELPALDPDANKVLPKIKLPDSVKRHMGPSSASAPEPVEWAAMDSEGLMADAAAGAASEAVAEEAKSDVGEVFAGAVEQSEGNSAPLLSALLKDPRFALISVKFLAFGLKRETAILWAAESATLGYALAGQKDPNVKMSQEEEIAIEQAKAYASGQEVSPENLSSLAGEIGMDKPGALAAQAAAWDQAPPPPEAGDPDILVGDMVAGAVLLSAAMTLPAPPKSEADQVPQEVVAQMDAPPETMPLVPATDKEVLPMAAALKPFVDKGLELAATA